MEYVALIAAILPLISKYGPTLVGNVNELIKGNPQKAGETDDQYIARINGLIEVKLADAEIKDAAIENQT